MKTIKLLLLLLLITSCSPEDDIPEECKCTRYDYELTFEIIGSSTVWNEELLDSYDVVCQDEKDRVFYYNNDGVRKFYNIECINND